MRRVLPIVLTGVLAAIVIGLLADRLQNRADEPVPGSRTVVAFGSCTTWRAQAASALSRSVSLAARVPAMTCAAVSSSLSFARRGPQASEQYERFVEIRAPGPETRQVADVAVRRPVRFIGLGGRLARRRLAEKCRLLGHPGSIQTMSGRVHW